MLKQDIHKELDHTLRKSIFSYCGGQVESDNEGRKLILDGNKYDNLNDIPDEKLQCTQNNISVNYTSNGGLSVRGGGKEIEVSSIGQSNSRNPGELMFGGEEKGYSIRDGEITETESTDLAPLQTNQELRDVCRELEGYLSAWNGDSKRPATACRIRDAGGRGRAVLDGSHFNDMDDDEFKIGFGKIEIQNMGIVKKYGFNQSRKQGEFTTKKEDTSVSDGNLVSSPATNAKMAGSR